MAIRRRGHHGKSRSHQPSEKKVKMNSEIKVPEVRLLDEDKSLIGVMPTKEALDMAYERNVDLIEIVPKAKPPVCQLIPYNKYMYQLKKKEKQKQKKQKEAQVQLKSMRLGVNTEAHDYNFKLDKIREFLESNNKVQIFVMFKGRQMIHKDRGYKLLEDIKEDIKDIGEVESKPRMAGNRLIMVVIPKKENS